MTVHCVTSTIYAHLTTPLMRAMCERTGMEFREWHGDKWTKLEAVREGGIILDADVVPHPSLTAYDLSPMRQTTICIDQGKPRTDGRFVRFCNHFGYECQRGEDFFNSGVMSFQPMHGIQVYDFWKSIEPDTLRLTQNGMKDQFVINLALRVLKIQPLVLPPEYNRMFDGPWKFRHFAGGQKDRIPDFIHDLETTRNT